MEKNSRKTILIEAHELTGTSLVSRVQRKCAGRPAEGPSTEESAGLDYFPLLYIPVK